MTSRQDVHRKVESTWSDAEQRIRIWLALDRYGSEDTESDRARVQLAILKLSEGSLTKVE